MLGILTEVINVEQKASAEKLLETIKERFNYPDFNVGTEEGKKYFTFKVRIGGDIPAVIHYRMSIVLEIISTFCSLVENLNFLRSCEEFFYDDDYMMEFLLQGEEKNE